MLRNISRWAYVAPVAVFALLIPGSPAQASVGSVSLTPDTAAPGETVTVSARFGAADWSQGVIEVGVLLAGTPPPATLELGAQPAWASRCTIDDAQRTVGCDWVPQAATDTVQLELQLLVSDTAPAGTSNVVAESVVVEEDRLNDLAITTLTVTEPAQTEPPTTEPPGTEPPEGTDPPAETTQPAETAPSTETDPPGQMPVPTVVSAGDGGLPRGAPLGPLAAGLLALVAAGGVARVRRARSQVG